ncbi:MAG: type II toxin-antitoxin system VapC family toxin [Pseudomonadota bacterium]
MIVVDTDVIAAFWIKTARTDLAHRARRRDADWIAPLLWRSEMRSVLRQYLTHDLLAYADALWTAEKAEAMLAGQEYAVRTPAVLKLVERTGHSAYDCEFVALAEAQGVPLVTGDRRLAERFPQVAMILEDFVQG